MVTRPRPAAAVLEALFDKPYGVSLQTHKIGRFDCETTLFISTPRSFLRIPMPGKLVGKIVLSSKYIHLNGDSSFSDSANVSWYDSAFSRQYADRVYKTLKDHQVRLEGASSVHR